jgi:pyridinium-3,5-bisthiocarboxylic acid mononucleotide nickel chelatase
MRIAYFDIFSGISGDMTLGAFVSAGLPLDELRSELAKIDLGGYSITERRITRSMVSATKIDVEVADTAHGEHGHAHQRSYLDIMRLIDASRLNDSIKARSKAIFQTIAKAEAKIHDTTVDKVHFHEVGAIDSIVDIVGAAICIEKLGIECVYSSPVRTGSGGFITTQHGVMPIPTPATIEILKGYPVELTDVPHELTTPTGAAIVATLSRGILSGLQDLAIDSIGYGAGGREIPNMPNMLRVMIGTLPDGYMEERLALIETNIDDMNPEVYPYLIELLIERGAHDAYVVPVLMKKGRPGHLLCVACSETMTEPLIRIIYSETTTTGVRIQRIERKKLERDVRIVDSSFGSVSVKVVVRDGRETIVPEFEECRRIARERGLPLLQVYKQLERDCA